jgi:hypothetical protein
MATKITRIGMLAATAGAAALALAAPASAELTDGTYQITFPANPSKQPRTIVINSCGPGCKHGHINGAEKDMEFHLDGNTWTANYSSGAPMTTIDNDTLGGILHQQNDHPIQLTKQG